MIRIYKISEEFEDEIINDDSWMDAEEEEDIDFDDPMFWATLD